MKEVVRKALYFKGAGVRGYKYNIHQKTSEDKVLNEKPRELFILLIFTLFGNQENYI